MKDLLNIEGIRTHQALLLDVLRHIQYSSFNRSNKQKLASILELTKASHAHTMPELVSQLENIIFSTSETLEVAKNLYKERLIQTQKRLIELLNNELDAESLMGCGEVIAKK